MAEVVASGVLNSLVDRLRDRITNEFDQLMMDVGAELKKLEGTLSTIRDVLEDAEARQVQERALRGWLQRLKDVAYDIDDLLDDDFACRNRKRSLTPESSTNWAKGKVSKVLSLPNSVMSQLKIVREIREIRERLDELAEDRSKFHLLERSVVRSCRQENADREETGSFVIESEVFGREEDKKKIIKYIVDASGGDLGIIAIVGMGGVGKTTLAQLVYNDQQISSHFEKKIWACVSNDFDPKRLVRSIIEYITGNACDLTSMASMQSKLRQELGKRRFLLVLDDVWNENYKEWDRVRTLLITIGGMGSKVIVTTRSSQVAYLMATAEPHFLKALSEDDCWLLFEKRAFGIGACEKTNKLVLVGKEIVKKCGGIPLAAKALGSLMHSKRKESDWSAIRDNDIWNFEENEILPALRLSYNHLPPHLKQCFAYCSIFPKDIFIETETLIQLWIAEGFVQPFDKSVELADVGMRYLKELLSRSLFEKVDIWSDGTLTNIKIHDLVHDLAQSVSGEECSIIDKDGHRKGIYPMTRYSSFIYAKETIPSILEILDKANKLRTFYFHASHGDVLVKTESSQQQKDEENTMLQILQTTFSGMKLLRALHLRYFPIKELPISISNLRHLRYLDLSSTVLATLPTSIGLLQNLQILNLQQCSILETLPTSIGSLFNLQILNLMLCESLKELPESIGDLSELLTLNLSSCKSLFSLPSSIGNLRRLQHLDLSFSSVQKLPGTICHLSNLRSINLWCCHALRELPVSMTNMTPNLYHVMDGCHDLTTTPPGLGRYAVVEDYCYFVPAEKFERVLLDLSGLKLEDQLINRSPRGTPGYAGSKATLKKNFVKQSKKYLSLL